MFKDITEMKKDLKFKEKELQESNFVKIEQHFQSIGGIVPSKKNKSKADDASSRINKQIGRQVKKRNSASFSKGSDGMNRS